MVLLDDRTGPPRPGRLPAERHGQGPHRPDPDQGPAAADVVGGRPARRRGVRRRRRRSVVLRHGARPAADPPGLPAAGRCDDGRGPGHGQPDLAAHPRRGRAGGGGRLLGTRRSARGPPEAGHGAVGRARRATRAPGTDRAHQHAQPAADDGQRRHRARSLRRRLPRSRLGLEHVARGHDGAAGGRRACGGGGQRRAGVRARRRGTRGDRGLLPHDGARNGAGDDSPGRRVGAGRRRHRPAPRAATAAAAEGPHRTPPAALRRADAARVLPARGTVAGGEETPMSEVVVLGGGMVGGIMTRDLATEPGLHVTVVDRDPAVLERLARRAPVATERADLSDPDAVRVLCRRFDLVVGAAPGFLGLRCLRAVLEAGKPVVDISFMPEDARQLDGLAREKNVTAVVDCGVAPGLSNLFCGRAMAELRDLERVLILVGGLPVVRRWPWEYAAVFSPIDVIEEYTRPARFVEHGTTVVREALSEPELVELPGVGTVEAFNTDGLRSLLDTVHAPFVKEKTLRWPGHIEKIRVLRALGLLGTAAVHVGGVEVRPIDLTAKLLFPQCQLRDGDEEFTVLRVEADGRLEGRRVRRTWDLLDRTDRATGETSMARTTGFPATIMARMLLRGEVRRPGVHPPEAFGGEPAIVERMRTDLARRGVAYSERTTPLPEDD
ncbi:MAG: saccharopine dehydrogenase NADP-binding domain-containing protein [Deltaproteobacteria bacterium]|nr:saccharopine dehydrogenase NADP-binding domain-containing protein [Deltaproteobacteria bacterium]